MKKKYTCVVCNTSYNDFHSALKHLARNHLKITAYKQPSEVKV